MVSVHLFSLVLFGVFAERYLAGVLCYLSLCCLDGKSDLEAECAALTTFPTVLPAAWQFDDDGARYLEEVRVKGLGCSPRALKLTLSMAAFVPQDNWQCWELARLHHRLSWSETKPWAQ